MKKIIKKFKPLLGSKKRLLLLAGIILFVALLVFLLKSWFIVAVVNRTPITRLSLDQELEKQGGKQVLDNRVTEILIFQEAQKQKVQVSDADIDARIKEIENQLSSQGQNLDSLLAAQGQTRESLRGQVKIPMLVEKLLGKDIQISDADISAYFESNKAFYPKGTTLESKKESIKNELYQQKLQEKFQTWIADLKQQAKIYYFSQF